MNMKDLEYKSFWLFITKLFIFYNTIHKYIIIIIIIKFDHIIYIYIYMSWNLKLYIKKLNIFKKIMFTPIDDIKL